MKILIEYALLGSEMSVEKSEKCLVVISPSAPVQRTDSRVTSRNGSTAFQRSKRDDCQWTISVAPSPERLQRGAPI